MESVSEAVWADILGHVRTRHPGIARGWFNQLSPGPIDRGELVIHVENPPQLVYLVDHCVRPFVEAAQAATGRLVTVSFQTRSGERGEPRTESSGDETFGYEHALSPARLNGDYTFENFVVGPCNRLAHASCSAAGDSPGTVYNPLFIHGSAGLGKTHLLQAVCHRVLDHSPAARIAHITCETFVNHYIQAVGRGGLEGFRYRFRHVDLLTIDDVQFLAGKDGTQEEFFHTFNALYQMHKQIILTADCMPSEIPALEERLVSRFKWGLVARIDPPCLETRQAIIHKKSQLLGLDLSMGAIEMIASRITTNTRELEGALNRLHGMAKLEGRKADLAMVQLCLGEQNPVAAQPIRLQDIMGMLTKRFDVRMSDLQGRRRSRSIAQPRQIGMYLARQLTSHSLEEIGGFFGGRDHTTALHACRAIARKCKEDVAFRARLEELETELRRG